MSRACFRVLFALGWLALLASCSGPTSILLRVTSPLPVPGQVDSLGVQITGDSPTATISRTYVVTGFPQTISLRPGPMSMGHVTISVTGLHGRTPVVQRVVSAMFVSGTQQTVEVDLPADCVGVMCGDGIDCQHGHCVSTSDGGPVDGGPIDVGPHDMGMDAPMFDMGPPDAGCASDTVCDDHVACTHDVCMTGVCMNVPDDTLCAVGATCSATGCPPRVCAMDAECDDHLFCNGVETCVGTTCTAAAMSACDDGDNCTTDVCDEASQGCMHRTRDADMDGFGDLNCPAAGGVPNTDCNDGDAMVSPSEIDVCDGIDNDCSGTCDTLNTCCRGAVEACHTSCDATGAMTGTHVCGGSCSWSSCSPPAETCNGRDDDCNGTCDDGAGLTCCAGATSSCTTTCGTMGTHVCGADCTFGMAACTPPADTCNGVDDDCDGTPDNGTGLACAIGHIQNCTTTCGSTGTQLCTASCQWPATCTPPMEICGNGVDDNCTGGIDEGCMGACGSCPGSTAVSGTGGRYSVTLGASSTTAGTCGGAGPEASMNFTLTVPSDVFITTHGATQDTVVYVRSCTCTGPELGCNNDATGRTSSALQLTNLPAGSYDVIIDSAAGASGTVPVDLYINPTGTASDRCATATAIAPAATSIAGNTCGFTNDYDNVMVGTTAAMCPYAQDGNAVDRVYYFYLPAARTITMNGATGTSNYDQVIYIRSVCNDGGATAQLGCNDDGGTGAANSCTGALRSSGSFMLPAGLYYAFIDGYDDATSGYCACGAYTFNLTGF